MNRVLAAWRSITREELVATFLLGIALWLYHIPAGLVDIDEPPTAAVIAIADQIKVWPILLAYVAVDHLASPPTNLRFAYVVAACAGAAVSAPLSVLFATSMMQLFGYPAHARAVFVAYIGLETAMLASAVLWIIADRARAARARERMHRAELARIDAEKRSVESDLQAMQARVEPRFLFGTLAQVKRLYERDAALGERMMDELIAYLRAAMPRMRDTSSTVAQECDLARAYLAIVNVGLGDRLGVAVDCPAGAEAVRMPPMMLLPLVEHALERVEDPSADGRTLHVRAEISSPVLRLTIADSGGGYRPGREGESIGGIRERLAALYATAGSLVLRDGAGGASAAILELPAETSDDIPAYTSSVQ